MRGHQVVVVEVVADHDVRFSGSVSATGRGPETAAIAATGTGLACFSVLPLGAGLGALSILIACRTYGAMATAIRPAVAVSPSSGVTGGLLGDRLGWQERERRLVRLVAGPERPVPRPQQPLPERFRALVLARVGRSAGVELHWW